jgi:hypothetical protein
MAEGCHEVYGFVGEFPAISVGDAKVAFIAVEEGDITDAEREFSVWGTFEFIEPDGTFLTELSVLNDIVFSGDDSFVFVVDGGISEEFGGGFPSFGFGFGELGMEFSDEGYEEISGDGEGPGMAVDEVVAFFEVHGGFPYRFWSSNFSKPCSSSSSST